MVWFKIDDGFYSHPKVLSIPRSIRAEAVGTWTLAGDWSAHQLTDGAIPSHMVEELGGSEEGALALVKAALWTKTRTGFAFRSWGDYQPTREQVEGVREAERKRKADQRARARGRHQDDRERPGGSPTNVPAGHQWDTGGSPSTPSRPDPTRPEDPYVSPVGSVPEGPGSTDDDGRATRRNALARLGVSDFDAVMRRMLKATERDLSERQVFQVVLSILERASEPVKNPQRYVLGAIEQSWAEIQRDLDEAAAA